jgi:hypothetical protein
MITPEAINSITKLMCPLLAFPVVLRLVIVEADIAKDDYRSFLGIILGHILFNGGQPAFNPTVGIANP